MNENLEKKKKKAKIRDSPREKERKKKKVHTLNVPANFLQRDFFYMISNTRSMKLISYCRKAHWVKRCEESVWVCWSHSTSGRRRGIIHFKEDQNMFYTCSGHILKPQTTFTTHELTNGL